jgi:hypothetical protein
VRSARSVQRAGSPRRTPDPARGLLVRGVLALAGLVAGCGGLAPGGQIGPVVDVAGLGIAEVASFEPPDPAVDPAGGQATTRWTGAATVLGTEDGQLLVVWNGGPVKCWGLDAIHFTARGATVAASVGERPMPVPGRCEGDSRLRAVFVPKTAVPAPGSTSWFPRGP